MFLMWAFNKKTRQGNVLGVERCHDHWCVAADLGQSLALGCHGESAESKKKLKALLTRPSGRDHKLC